MKIGYSNLLRHLVDAPDIEHGECETLQIVCPECREPVFKTERGTGTSRQHFLSHYGADKAMIARCELRVGALTTGESRASAAEGRGQNLAFFLRTLREMVEETSARYLGRSTAPIRLPTVRQILDSGITSAMLVSARDQAIGLGLEEVTELARRAYRDHGYQRDYGGPMLNDLRQDGYATDMIATLFSPACRRDCRVVLAHGWAQGAAYIAQQLGAGRLDERMTKIARILIETPQISSSRARRRMAQHDQRLIGDALVVVVLHAMSTVRALNYAGWLARAR